MQSVLPVRLLLWWGVVETEAESEILHPKFAGQRRKWIRCRDAGPGGAIQRNVSGSGYHFMAATFLSGLGSSTYSQPGSGPAQFCTSIFESADALVSGGALFRPTSAPVQTRRAVKPGEKDTERRQNKNGRRFAFIHYLWNSRLTPDVYGLYASSCSALRVRPRAASHLTRSALEDCLTPPTLLEM